MNTSNDCAPLSSLSSTINPNSMKSKFTKGKKIKTEQWNNSNFLTSSDILNFMNGTLNNSNLRKQLNLNSAKVNEDLNEERSKEDKDSCRSLLCDSNGIVFAEMIYRCTVCSAIHEFVGDAKQHYHRKHMNNDYSLATSLNSLNNLSRVSSSSIDNLYDESTSNSNNLNLDNSQAEDNEQILGGLIDKIRDFGKYQKLNHNKSNNANMLNNNNNSAINLNNNLNQNSQSLALCLSNFNLYKNEQLMMNENMNNMVDDGFYSKNSSLLTNYDCSATSKSYRTTESCTRSGFITCPVCCSHRFYTTLQRRYGQFTCVACYRFFKEFFINPQVYNCPSLSNCSLNVKQKCKACWIYACMRVYSVDNKRKSILESFKPVNSSMDFQLQILNNIDSSFKPSSENNEELEEENNSSQTSKDESFPLDFTKKIIDIKAEENDIIDEKNSEDNDDENDKSISREEQSSKSDDQDSIKLSSNDNEYSSKNFSLMQISDITDWNNNSLLSDSDSSCKKKREFITSTAKKTKQRVKNWSCLKCDNCLADDCGKCINCLDRPKFGGQFVRRCIKRKCLMKLKNKKPVNTSTFVY